MDNRNSTRLNASSVVETGNITNWNDINLASGYTDAQGFFIKVETTAGVLYVVPFKATSDTPIATTFSVGWNLEKVRSVAVNAGNTAVGVKWGK